METYKSFPCSKKDVASIAKSRINDQEKQFISKWTWVTVIIAIVGIIVSRFVNDFAGYGIMAVAVVIFFWFTGKLTKKQKLARQELLEKWEELG